MALPPSTDPSALSLEPTLCHGLVEAIATSRRSQADNQGVKLVVAQGLEEIVAHTDRRILSTIVIGLIDEAIASAPRGVVHVSVLGCIAGGRKAVEISIAGLHAEPSTTAARPSDVESFALGRGAALAAALGGEISVQRKPGEGGTYVLRFPEML